MHFMNEHEESNNEIFKKTPLHMHMVWN